ncbi:MAG: hypothetical protein GY862_39255, partial [Gammaproteobacteria bacterium]|nr:hypothetical protein [Gammaproteobacteria bacterium]
MKLGIWLLCFCMHAASAQTTLGRVLEFGCDNDETENALDRFYLKRYDKHKTLQLLQPLRAKDRLVLVNHACYITFSVGDKIERVDRKMPSYLIEHAKQSSSMDRLVTALFDTPARVTAGTAATKRGDVDELIMPLFVKLPREKYLIAGRHELFLT